MLKFFWKNIFFSLIKLEILLFQQNKSKNLQKSILLKLCQLDHKSLAKIFAIEKKMTKNGFNMRKKLSGFLGFSGSPGSRTFFENPRDRDPEHLCKNPRDFYIPGIGIFFRGMGNPDKKPPMISVYLSKV